MSDLPGAMFDRFTALTGGAHNAFYEDVRGRMTRGYTESSEYPRAAFWSVTDDPEYPGGKIMEDSLWQFDLFSASSSYVEIDKMLADLRLLYDDCTLTITGQTLVCFIRRQKREVFDGITITTDAGTVGVKHYVQEYEVTVVN